VLERHIDSRILERDLLAERCERAERERDRAIAERDAWKAAVDRHVSDSVRDFDTGVEGTMWYAEPSLLRWYATREEAEAAYRQRTGLDVGAAAGEATAEPAWTQEPPTEQGKIGRAHV